MKFRINDINNFVATSNCSTIMQAAKKLEISQPALSESIKRLEHDLGLLLFYRSRTGIKLTPSGKIFLKKALSVVNSINNLKFDNQSKSIFNGRAITIGSHPTVAQYSIPKALSYLKLNAPDYNIELKHDLSRNIQYEIQKGNIDIGIIINPVRVPDLIIQKMSLDLVRVWCKHEEKVNEKLDTIICNLDLFQTQSILKKWKNRPAKIISTDSLELICKLVDEKIGYGIIPERAVKISGLNLRPQKTLPSVKDEICLVYRPEFGKSLFEKLTLDALKKAIND